LFEKRLFQVPDYQRGYAWEEEQLDDFLEDLEMLAKGSVHYTGNVVLHCVDNREVKDKHGKTYGVYNLVDGQQRLTTFVLLLAAIRQELISLKETDLAAGIYDTYIAVPDQCGQSLAKLTLNSDCHRFFFDNVLHGRPYLDGVRIRSHRNLDFAKKHFLKFLNDRREAKKDKYLDWLEELRHKVCEQLILTVYPVQHDADAGVIFEVMNNRGKPITELEKTKNYLLYLASKLLLPARHDLCERINRAWTHIFTRLMSSGRSTEENEDQLLRAHWLMAYDPEEKKWNGCKSIKDRFHLTRYVGKHETLLRELVEYVQTLADAATAYCDVFSPEHPDAFAGIPAEGGVRKKVVEAADKLPRLGIFAPFLPLLIAIRMKHPENWDFYQEVIKDCELFAFRVYRLLQKRSNTGRRELVRLANSLYAGRKTPLGVLMEIHDLIRRFSRNTEIDDAYVFDPEDNWYEWTGLRYFLYEYESHLCQTQNKDARISWRELEKLKHSIEHVLPQNPTSDYWRRRWSESKRKKYINDIGNLCLTRDNSSYSNKSFPEKKGDPSSAEPCYAKGNFLMERDLAAAYADWTEETLLQRREEMIAWATERWSLPTAGSTTFDWSIPTTTLKSLLFTLKWQFQE
jgi:hypothetical protein